MKKIKLNNRFHAYWGSCTPKAGDILEVVRKDRKGYWVKVKGISEECRIWFDEADVYDEIDD